MEPITLSFDVTADLPAELSNGQRLHLAAWLFIPADFTSLGSQPVAMVLVPGGSYSKRYFHLEFAEHSGYSAAEYLAGQGNIVLLLDHLGMGDSTRTANQKLATRHLVAQASHAAVQQFRQRLLSGELHPALPALANLTLVGGGHSMGGMVTLIQQANHRSYDAIMVLGYTVAGVHLTLNGQQVRADNGNMTAPDADYLSGPRDYLHEGFHWEDVPADIIALDDAQAVPTPAHIGLDSIRTGIVVAEAARIDVPTLILLGERDVSPDPHGEPAYYRQCCDLTLFIQPRSGHCQNFASSRAEGWQRMHRWARSVAK